MYQTRFHMIIKMMSRHNTKSFHLSTNLFKAIPPPLSQCIFRKVFSRICKRDKLTHITKIFDKFFFHITLLPCFMITMYYNQTLKSSIFLTEKTSSPHQCQHTIRPTRTSHHNTLTSECKFIKTISDITDFFPLSPTVNTMRQTIHIELLQKSINYLNFIPTKQSSSRTTRQSHFTSFEKSNYDDPKISIQHQSKRSSQRNREARFYRFYRIENKKHSLTHIRVSILNRIIGKSKQKDHTSIFHRYSMSNQ